MSSSASDAAAAAGNEALSTLTAMGFPETAAKNALAVCNNNLEAAAIFLMGDDSQDFGASNATNTTAPPSHPAMSSTTSSASKPASMTVATMSQYSFEQGRSACTCMALQMAASILENQPRDASTLVTSRFLNSNLQLGVNAFAHVNSSSSEHLSAEQALPHFTSLKQLGSIQQGILVRGDPSHPQGLHRLLFHDCRPPNSSSWTCVVMTKTPETILLCLPPPLDGGASGNDAPQNYVLIDSHPRPHLWPVASQAYARFHSDMESLIENIQAVFPVVDLGSDVPELMAAMYNSFDLYVLESNRNE